MTQALARLADKNLVAVVPRPGGTRYRMLETIRQYGGERMDQVVEQADVRRRHLSWCLATATQLRDGTATEGDFDEVVDDLRAGLGWAATQPSCRADAYELALRLAELTFPRGMPSEAQRRYEEAAALTPDPAEAHHALHLAAAVAWGRQSGNRAVELHRAAADAARQAGDTRAAALDLARAAEIINRAPGLMSELPPEEEESALLAQAQELAFGDPHLEAATLTVLGCADLFDSASGEILERAVELARRVGDTRLEAAALDGLTAVKLALSEMEAAVAIVERRLNLLTPRADEVELAWEYTDVFHMAPLVHLTSGNLAAARRYSEQRRALPFFREAEHLAVVWLLTTDAVAGDFDEAAALAGRFRRGWEEAGRPTRGGYAFGPAAASMVFGIRGDDAARAEWHEISADMRSAVAERFGNDTAYLRTFDGMVALHHGELGEALTATSRGSGVVPAVARRRLAPVVHRRVGRDRRTRRTAGPTRTSRQGEVHHRAQPRRVGDRRPCRGPRWSRHRAAAGHRRRTGRGRLPVPMGPEPGPRRWRGPHRGPSEADGDGSSPDGRHLTEPLSGCAEPRAGPRLPERRRTPGRRRRAGRPRPSRGRSASLHQLSAERSCSATSTRPPRPGCRRT